MLDITQFDLDTDSGQEEAINAIIDELNGQYESTGGLNNYLNIAAYNSFTVNIPDFGIPGNTYQGSFYHGLGYQPAFLGWYNLGSWAFGPNTQNGYANCPWIDGVPGSSFQDYYRMWVDTKNVYASHYVGPNNSNPEYAPIPSHYPNNQYPVETFYFLLFQLPMPANQQSTL